MTLPRRSGLYDPKHEHDACGIGFVANIDGNASHRIVQQGLQILLNLVHRGASGREPLTGDGAGLLLQMPHEFFKKECQAIGIDLPNIGEYGIGCVFLPQDPNDREKCERILEDKVLGTGQKLLGWRDVPVRSETPGPVARRTVPYIRQIVIGSSCASPKEF